MSRSWRISTVLLIALVTFVASSFAQRQVAFDDGGTVFVITKALEQRVRLFDLNGFEEARIFQQSDSSYILEITMADSLGFWRTTRGTTAAEIQSMRLRWTLAMGAETPAPKAASEQLSAEGRARMVQTITGLGIGWYGWTIPAIMGGESGPLPFSLYLFTAAATYFAADGFMAERSYGEAEAAAFMYFATRGILHGYALNTLATNDYGKLRTGFPAGTIVSLVEGLTVSRWAARTQVPVGRIRAMGAVGDAGLLLGLGTAYATSSSDRPFFDDAGDRPGPYAVGVLGGNAMGILAGLWLAGSDHFAPGDADLMESAGYLGAAAGFTVSDLAGVVDRRSQVAAAMAGLVAGQVMGGRLAASADLTGSEGNRVGLITSGGILVGLGIGYALDQDAKRTHYWTFGTLGGIGGFALANAMLRRSASRASLEMHPDGLLRPIVRTEGDPRVELRPLVTLSVAVR